MIYIVTGKMGSGKYTWIEKTIKRRKKEYKIITYSILDIGRLDIQDINAGIYYANIKNEDVYIVSVDINYVPDELKKQADKIKIFY